MSFVITFMQKKLLLFFRHYKNGGDGALDGEERAMRQQSKASYLLFVLKTNRLGTSQGEQSSLQMLV